MKYKLYDIWSRDLEQRVQFVSYTEPKEFVRFNCFGTDEYDLRTIRALDFPEDTFKLRNMDNSIYIFFNSKPIVIWSDDANVDYPEDLVWERDIGTLVYEVVELTKLQYGITE